MLMFDGLGAAKIGMSVREAEHALHARLVVDDSGSDEEYHCSYFGRADGKEANVSYMVERGRITRIDIGEDDTRSRQSVAVTDQLGFGIGSQERAIIRAYGKRLVVENDPTPARPGTGSCLTTRGTARQLFF